MWVKCHNCGTEDSDRWMFKYFVGRGTIYLCEECHRNGLDKVDANLNKHWQKKERKRLNEHK